MDDRKNINGLEVASTTHRVRRCGDQVDDVAQQSIISMLPCFPICSGQIPIMTDTHIDQSACYTMFFVCTRHSLHRA